MISHNGIPVADQNISCQGCGAMLPLEEDVGFLNCNHCHCRLEVIRKSETTFTRLLDGLDGKTDAPEKGAGFKELYAELDELEKNWKRYYDRILLEDRWGRLVPPDSPWVFRRTIIPSSVFIVAAAANCVLTELVWLSFFLAVLGILLGRSLYKHGTAKVRDYEAARKDYQMRHLELKQRIEEGLHVHS